MKSYNVFPFVPGFFHLAPCFQFIRIIGWVRTSFLFYGWIILHCMDMPQFVYPFICWWTFVLSSFGSCESVDMNICADVFVWTSVLILLAVYLWELLDHMVILYLTFEKLSNCLPQWMNHFTFPWAMHMGSNFLKSL